jgi:isopenicillin N synthase-like dioxygenase
MWEGWVPVYRGDPDIVKEGVPNLVEWFQLQKFEDFELWPERPTEMRAIWLAYYKACRDLASRIVAMIAESLDLPEGDVDAWTERAFCNLAVNNYPPQEEPPLPGQVRLSAHTDENALTMLISRKDPGGLQIRKPGAGEDEWASVRIPPGAVFVQPGDLLARWTNRLIHANHHRVVNPPGQVTAERRQTIIFFHYPDWETVVTPAPSCVARTGEALPSLNVGEHILRNQEVYSAGDEEKRLDDAKV